MRELDGYLSDAVVVTLVLLPSVLYIVANKHEVIFTYRLHGIADHTSRSVAVSQEVKLIFLMAVHRKCESVLISVNKIKAILF